jgi:hypothetical protein
MAAQCTVRFQTSKLDTRKRTAVAVLYARDGRSLNYIVMSRPVSVSKARAVKAKLMKGCAELSRRGRGR